MTYGRNKTNGNHRSSALNEVLKTDPSIADFLCQHWRPEHCDPSVWEAPSTYDVADVELVGDPHMKLWSETTAWDNPGRNKILQKDIKHFADVIETEGIIPSRVVYYDVDTDETNNGAHRRGLSVILGIPGWMHQGVRFLTKTAKIRFANVSNHVEELYHLAPKKQDIKIAVSETLNLEKTFSKQAIRSEVQLQGVGLTERQRLDVINDLYSDFMLDDRMITTERYRDLNNDNVERLLNAIEEEDPWVKDFWLNDDEYTICVNAGNFESRIGSLLASAAIASQNDKPLHIVFVVPIPKGKETLTSKREKFFSMHLDSLEERMIKIYGLADNAKSHRMFPWNHADAEHRAVGQDTQNEGNVLIKVSNRSYN